MILSKKKFIKNNLKLEKSKMYANFEQNKDFTLIKQDVIHVIEIPFNFDLKQNVKHDENEDNFLSKKAVSKNYRLHLVQKKHMSYPNRFIELILEIEPR